MPTVHRAEVRVNALSVGRGRGRGRIAEWVNLLQLVRRRALPPQQRAVAPSKCDDDQRAVLDARHEDVVVPYRGRRVAGWDPRLPQAVGRRAERGGWLVSLGHARAIRPPETRPLRGRWLLPDERTSEHTEPEQTWPKSHGHLRRCKSPMKLISLGHRLRRQAAALCRSSVVAKCLPIVRGDPGSR